MRKKTFYFMVVAAVLVCFVLVEAVSAEVTFEFWDTSGYEAFTRCELRPAFGSAQLSEDDKWPGANTGYIDLSCFAELGDELDPLADYALASVSVSGDTYSYADVYHVNIHNEGIVSTNLKNAGEIKSEVEGYFLLAMYVPSSEVYKYTIDYAGMYTELDPQVDFDDGSWHITMNGDHGFSLTEDGFYEGQTGLLIGKDDFYLLYGGFKFSATDTTADSVGIDGQIFQNIEISMAPISNFVNFASFANTWQLAEGQTGYDDQWDLVDDGIIDIYDLAEFRNSWLD